MTEAVREESIATEGAGDKEVPSEAAEVRKNIPSEVVKTPEEPHEPPKTTKMPTSPIKREQEESGHSNASLSDLEEPEDPKKKKTGKNSKIPRPLRRKELKAETQSGAAKTLPVVPPSNMAGIESRFRLQLKKYKQFIKEITLVHGRMTSCKETVRQLREQMLEGGLDPEEVPELEIPSLQTPSSTSQAKQTLGPGQSKVVEKLKSSMKILQEENMDLIQKVKNLHAYYESQMTYVSKVKNEMPQLEEHYRGLVANMKKAEAAQNSLEQRIIAYSREIEELSGMTNQCAIQKQKADKLQKELNILQTERDKDRLYYEDECTKFEEEYKSITDLLQQERELRKEMEISYDELSEEKRELEDQLADMTVKFEDLQSSLPDSAASARTAEIIEHLKEESKEAKQSLMLAEKLIRSLKDEHGKITDQMIEMEKARTEERNILADRLNAEIGKREIEINKLNQKVDVLKQEKDGAYLIIRNMEKEKEDGKEMSKECIQSLKEEVENLRIVYLEALGMKKKLEKEIEEKSAEVKGALQLAEEHRLALVERCQLVDSLQKREQERIQEVQRLVDVIRSQEIPSTKEKEPDEIQEDPEPAKVETVLKEQVKPFPDVPSEVDRSWAPDYAEVFSVLEEKRLALGRLERRLREAEAAHSTCARKRTNYECRIAQLEVALACTPPHPLFSLAQRK